jgi:hypothetical protein
MQIKKIDQKDYELICSWYETWGLPITPRSWFSSETYIIEDKCSASLYALGDSKMYWIEGLVTNPSCDKKLKSESIMKLIDFLQNRAKELGAEIVMTSTPRKGLQQMFIESGFNNAPEAYIHLARMV